MDGQKIPGVSLDVRIVVSTDHCIFQVWTSLALSHTVSTQRVCGTLSPWMMSKLPNCPTLPPRPTIFHRDQICFMFCCFKRSPQLLHVHDFLQCQNGFEPGRHSRSMFACEGTRNRSVAQDDQTQIRLPFGILERILEDHQLPTNSELVAYRYIFLRVCRDWHETALSYLYRNVSIWTYNQAESYAKRWGNTPSRRRVYERWW